MSDAQQVNESAAKAEGSNVRPLPGATGRMEPGQQEAILKNDVVKKAMPELRSLYRNLLLARAQYNEAAKAKAKESGYNAGPLKKFVKAIEEDKIPEITRDQEQLALLIFDVGE